MHAGLKLPRIQGGMLRDIHRKQVGMLRDIHRKQVGMLGEGNLKYNYAC